MIQGGGMDANMQEKPPAIPLKMKRTTAWPTILAPWPWRAPVIPTHHPSFYQCGQQRSITAAKPARAGAMQYLVVVEGMDVVESITKIQTGSAGFHQDVPVETIEITETIVSAYSDK